MKKNIAFLLTFCSFWLTSCVQAASPITPRPTSSPEISSIILSGHTEGVTQLAWNPQGTLLASAGRGSTDTTIRLWDAKGQPVHTLSGHTGPILSLAWSPDGSRLASGSADQTVRLWKADGSLDKAMKIGQGKVWAVAWSPDGKILATGSIVTILNPTVQLWDSGGNPILTLTTKFSAGKYYNLLWSPDGNFLLSGATDYALWRKDGTQVTYFSGCQFCTPAWGAAWSPDSSMFAIGYENGDLTICDSNGNLVDDRQSDFEVNSIAWSPDGSLLAAGQDVWRPGGSRLTSVSGQVNMVAWSQDGKYLAIAADDLIDIIRASDGAHLAALSGHTGIVNKIAWSPIGGILASASEDHTIRLWRLP
jgi:WD40 repeat protein